MNKLFAAALAVALMVAAPALAQVAYTDSLGGTRITKPVTPTTPLPIASMVLGTQVAAASGNVANAAATTTLPAVASVTNYITGFQCTAGGATTAAIVSLTVTGLLGGTETFSFGFPTGAAVQATPLAVRFDPPLAASAANTAIVVSLPAGGTGNTNASCNAQGFKL